MTTPDVPGSLAWTVARLQEVAADERDECDWCPECYRRPGDEPRFGMFRCGVCGQVL